MADVTLVEFLLARVVEDEGAARATGTPGLYAYEEGGSDGWAVEGTDGSEGAIIGDRALAEHIARHHPARVLAECQARRAVIELHEHVGSWLSEWDEGDPVPFESGEFGCRICALDDRQIEPEGWCATLRALAGPFKGHPDFDAGWSPK